MNEASGAHWKSGQASSGLLSLRDSKYLPMALEASQMTQEEFDLWPPPLATTNSAGTGSYVSLGVGPQQKDQLESLGCYPTSFSTADALIKDLHHKADDQQEMMAGVLSAIQWMNAAPRGDPLLAE